jgi:hypothetical protein
MGPRSLLKFSVVLCVASDIRGWGKVEGPGVAVAPGRKRPRTRHHCGANLAVVVLLIF